MKIAIAGTGYVGLVTAAVFAHIGHDVTGVDIDESKIAMLNAGKSTIFEPGLNELLEADKARLRFTTDSTAAYREADAIFIAVGTPEKADGSANLKYIYAVAGQIVRSVERDCLVVVKSTVPVGTNDKIQQYFDRIGYGSVRIEVASAPEFLSQGTAVKDMLNASRIVIGTKSEAAKVIVDEIYSRMGLPILYTDRRSAEMIKYASNDFLALKISYINEIANLCETIGANIEDVSRGMGLDPRIGDKFLRAGIGYGGSCFPKDTKALHWLSNYFDSEIKTIKAAVEVNSNQKLKLIKKARKYYGSFEGLTVAVLGLAFKPGTDDLRESPSLDNIPILLDDGATVKAWDPVAAENFKRHFPKEITYCETVQETLLDADLCFILTEWSDIVSIDPSVFSMMKTPVILDGRNCFELTVMERFPYLYDSIGRMTIDNLYAQRADHEQSSSRNGTKRY